MDLLNRKLNDIEQMFQYLLIELSKEVLLLIESKKNDNEQYFYDSDEKCNMEKYDYTSKWHHYLILAQDTLGGEYPDEECEDHAIFHAKQMLKMLSNELLNFPINVLENVYTHIYQHHDNRKCSLCEKE